MDDVRPIPGQQEGQHAREAIVLSMLVVNKFEEVDECVLNSLCVQAMPCKW